MDADDLAIARSLEDPVTDALDKLGLDSNGGFYFDPVSSVCDGDLPVQALILAVLQAYWEEYGR